VRGVGVARMFKRWRRGWCYGIYRQVSRLLRKKSGSGRQIGFRQEDEWFKLWQIGNGGSVWQKRLKDRERGAGRRNEVDAQKGIWWREKESGR